MGKMDKIKEQIGWLKVAFAIAVATAITLIGWLASNYERVQMHLSIASFVVILAVLVLIVIINKIAFKKMDELEEL